MIIYTTEIEITGRVVYAELEVEIAYTFQPGYAGDRIDPPEPAHCEIDAVRATLDGKLVPAPVVDWLASLIDDDDMQAQLLEAHHDGIEAAREAQAEADEEVWRLEARRSA